MESFSWTKSSEHAAQLVADGKLTFRVIGKKVGVSDVTLRSWRTHPEFQARVSRIVAEYKEETRRIGIAVREQRIRAQNSRWNKLQRIIQERGRDAKHQGVPGWETGLLTHDIKSVGSGDSMVVVDLYQLDTGLLKAMLDLEKQTPQDLGEWSEKVEATASVVASPMDQQLAMSLLEVMSQHKAKLNAPDPALHGRDSSGTQEVSAEESATS